MSTSHNVSQQVIKFPIYRLKPLYFHIHFDTERIIANEELADYSKRSFIDTRSAFAIAAIRLTEGFLLPASISFK